MSDNTVVPEEVTENKDTKTADDYLGYAPEIFGQLKEDTVDNSTEPQDKTEDIQEVINKTLKEIKVDDNGKFIYPDNISPELKAAIAATKSFRDTQSSYTKAQQELKMIKAEAEALKAQLQGYETPTSGLTPEEQQELSELKYRDPDAWYSKMKELEANAQARVQEKITGVAEQAKARTAEELRLEALKGFNERVETPLTPQELELGTPPLWQQKVMNGEWTMDEFLTKAYDLLHSSKTVVSPQVEPTTNLNEASGGDKDPQLENGIDYSKAVF